MGHGQGDPRKVVVAALLGNGAIAIAKFVAAFLSGSATMLAEAVHSVADTANQAFLLVGMKLSDKSAPERYPLGRSKEAYFWAFIVSLFLFFMGGVFAVYEGVHKLSSPPEAPGSQIVPMVVLGISLVMEGMSFSVAFREFNKTRGKKSFRISLSDVSPVTIAFSDRPDRDVSAPRTASFVKNFNWSAKNPPNAAIVVNGADGKASTVIVELTNPKFSASAKSETPRTMRPSASRMLRWE